MVSRSLVLFVAGASLALSATACSSLTKPNEITIAPEPVAAAAPAPQPQAAPAMPGNQPGAAPRPAGTG